MLDSAAGDLAGLRARASRIQAPAAWMSTSRGWVPVGAFLTVEGGSREGPLAEPAGLQLTPPPGHTPTHRALIQVWRSVDGLKREPDPDHWP